MWIALLLCSDVGCAETYDVEASTLAELESLSCNCGCGLALVRWPEWIDAAPAAVAALPVRVEIIALAA